MNLICVKGKGIDSRVATNLENKTTSKYIFTIITT
jgi:hypothetical protein